VKCLLCSRLLPAGEIEAMFLARRRVFERWGAGGLAQQFQQSAAPAAVLGHACSACPSHAFRAARPLRGEGHRRH
jgi:hypothetical protein